MMLHWLLDAIGISLLLLTMPLVIELGVLTMGALIFTAFKKKNEVSAPVAEAVRLIVVVPAHNEAQLIARTVASLRVAAEKAWAPVRICVIAHNCSDATAENAAAGAEVFPLNDDARGGKGNALLYAFTSLAPEETAASKTAFVVIDADTVVAPDLFQRIQSEMARGTLALQCRYEAISYNDDGTRKASLAALAFRAFNTVRARGRAQLGLSCGIFGNGFALRADLLRRIPYNAHSVVEDLEYHILLVHAGVRVEYLDDARLYGEIAGTKSQKTRWDGGRARMARQWVPRLMADVLRGKVRMLGPIFYVASLPLAQGLLLLILALLLPLPWLRITAAASLFIILVHVIAAVLAGDHPAEDFVLMLRLPVYLGAKLVQVPAAMMMSRTNAAWVRTSREGNDGEMK